MHTGSNLPDDDVDWGTAEYSADPRRAYDTLRDRCPVARSSANASWMITGHAEVRACALDAEAFSNRVSARLQIPNGLDGDEHRRFRTLTDRFFEPASIAGLEPRFRTIAEELIRSLPRRTPLDAVGQIGASLAVRFQCAWLGWPTALEPRLLQWMQEYRSAMRGEDPTRRSAVAEQFEAIVAEQIRARQGKDAQRSFDDVTTELIRSEVDDPKTPGGRRALTEPEVVSILRNWTAGDLGTIAACVGVIAQRVAADRELQSSLRTQLEQHVVLEQVIDECLRLDDPFLWNRRVAARDVHVGGRLIPAGAKVILNWTAANRDPSRFGDAAEFRPAENAPHNLVYGIGPHVCPGRQLATLQLRVTLAALLESASALQLAERAPSRASAPTGGYAQVWILLG